MGQSKTTGQACPLSVMIMNLAIFYVPSVLFHRYKTPFDDGFSGGGVLDITRKLWRDLGYRWRHKYNINLVICLAKQQRCMLLTLLWPRAIH